MIPAPVKPGREPDLDRLDPRETHGVTREQASAATEDHRRRLGELQEEMWVAEANSLLIVLQGMDTCGKDGTIRHVFRSVNPLGVRAVAFGVPTPEERARDYLWRVHNQVPGKGDMVVFNRSHYEAVLVERVAGIVPESIWKHRYDQINAFEDILVADGTIILKFFLHISFEEQRERLMERIQNPLKQWKVDQSDWDNRQRWDEYQAAYREALGRTSTAHAPWYVIPADRKWYRNFAVGQILLDRLSPYQAAWAAATLERGARQMASLEPEIRSLATTG